VPHVPRLIQNSPMCSLLNTPSSQRSVVLDSLLLLLLLLFHQYVNELLASLQIYALPGRLSSLL